MNEEHYSNDATVDHSADIAKIVQELCDKFSVNRALGIDSFERPETKDSQSLKTNKHYE